MLEGIDQERRTRARLVFQVASGRVYLVTSPANGTSPAPVTALPTFELLDQLTAYNWWLPLGPVLDESDEQE